VEIGISRGNFQVIRINPTDEQPEGSWVLRFIDPSGIAVVVGMSHEQGMQFRDGFVVPENEGRPKLVLPDDTDVRHLGRPVGSNAEQDDVVEAPAAS
jgi:hypothetical protein